MVRIRVVEGSCWPCKKRRTKCDLTKPVCLRCAKSGANCDYNAQLIRWSTRPPVRAATALHQVLPGLGNNGLEWSEKRALDYFHCRVWPLLQTSEEICPPPLPVALEHRVVLLAACVLSESHRILQDGTDRGSTFNVRRLECLAAIKSEIDHCCTQERGLSGSLLVLLFAVVLLHLHDGFLEPNGADASTASHRQGVTAILAQMGGFVRVLRSGPEPMQMLLAEFASADLTTAMLQGTAPSYAPDIWQVVDEGAVWWGRDPLGRGSLATVLREMSAMAFYHESIARGVVELSMDEVRNFEVAFAWENMPRSPQTLVDVEASPQDKVYDAADAVHALALIRSFQCAALIFLYRAVCGLPTHHRLVQTSVQSCLTCISEISKPSKALHCILFPLFVAGAHALSSQQRAEVVEMLDFIRDQMRFASIKAMADCVNAVWAQQPTEMTWTAMFSHLGGQVLIL